MHLEARRVRPLAAAGALGLALAGGVAATTLAPAADGDPGRSAAESRVLPRVKGQVGPDMTISVNRSSVVKGRYRIVVNDDSSAHNFHITGPGDVDRKTSVSGTGRTVWRVRLRPGTYTIVCDVHPETMNTSLRVTAD